MTVKRILLVLLFKLVSISAQAQQMYFPPANNVGAWEQTNPDSLGWCTQNLDTLDNYLQATNTKAFLVLKDGKIVIERYFGTFRQDSAWQWASAGKTITAFCVGLAQQENRLRISDSSSQYLGRGWTSCTPAQERAITIRHQLTMTTGLDDRVPDDFCTLPSCLRYLAPPNTRWAYHNGPYTMLDGVIEDASGQTLNQFFTQRVKNIIGMTGLFFPVGYNNVYFSTARSMARFGILMQAGGRWNSTQIMTDTGYFNALTRPSNTINKSYGYLWWLNGQESYRVPQSQLEFRGSYAPDAPTDMVAAIGKDGQILSLVPSQKLIIVRMGEDDGTSLVPFTYVNELWKRVNLVVCTPTSAKGTLEEEVLIVKLVSENNKIIGFQINSALPHKSILRNVLGQEIKLQASRGTFQPIPALPKGLYNLVVTTGKAQKVQQILVP
jgi:CubicO group peptidase (beta-lactamase class C family)